MKELELVYESKIWWKMYTRNCVAFSDYSVVYLCQVTVNVKIIVLINNPEIIARQVMLKNVAP